MKLSHLALNKIGENDLHNIDFDELEVIYPAFLQHDLQMKYFGCILKTDGNMFTGITKRGDNGETMIIRYDNKCVEEVLTPDKFYYPNDERLRMKCGNLHSRINIFPSGRINYIGYEDNWVCTNTSINSNFLLDGNFCHREKGDIKVCGGFVDGKMEKQWYKYQEEGSFISAYYLDGNPVSMQISAHIGKKCTKSYMYYNGVWCISESVDNNEYDNISVRVVNNEIEWEEYTLRGIKVYPLNPKRIDITMPTIFDTTQLLEDIEYFKQQV
jgi:hypothetical protein